MKDSVWDIVKEIYFRDAFIKDEQLATIKDIQLVNADRNSA